MVRGILVRFLTGETNERHSPKRPDQLYSPPGLILWIPDALARKVNRLGREAVSISV